MHLVNFQFALASYLQILYNHNKCILKLKKSCFGKEIEWVLLKKFLEVILIMQ